MRWSTVFEQIVRFHPRLIGMRAKNSPPQPRRGGCAIKQKREATFERADGVVLAGGSFPGQHHPVRSNEEASRVFLDVAATPPRLRRGALQTVLHYPEHKYGIWTPILIYRINPRRRTLREHHPRAPRASALRPGRDRAR